MGRSPNAPEVLLDPRSKVEVLVADDFLANIGLDAAQRLRVSDVASLLARAVDANARGEIAWTWRTLVRPPAGTLLLLYFPSLVLQSRTPPDGFVWRTDTTRSHRLCEVQSQTHMDVVVSVTDAPPTQPPPVTRRMYILHNSPSADHMVLVHYLNSERGDDQPTIAAAVSEPLATPDASAGWFDVAAARAPAPAQAQALATTAAQLATMGGRMPSEMHAAARMGPAPQKQWRPSAPPTYNTPGAYNPARMMGPPQPPHQQQQQHVQQQQQQQQQQHLQRVSATGIATVPQPMAAGRGEQPRQQGPPTRPPAAAGAPASAPALAPQEPAVGSDYYTELEAAAARFKHNHELMEDLFLPSAEDNFVMRTPLPRKRLEPDVAAALVDRLKQRRAEVEADTAQLQEVHVAKMARLESQSAAFEAHLARLADPNAPPETVADAQAGLEQLLSVKFVAYSDRMRAVTDLGYIARP